VFHICLRRFHKIPPLNILYYIEYFPGNESLSSADFETRRKFSEFQLPWLDNGAQSGSPCVNANRWERTRRTGRPFAALRWSRRNPRHQGCDQECADAAGPDPSELTTVAPSIK
jgi:hypothetical protein